MKFTFQITKSSRNSSKWRKAPFVIIEAASGKEAWNEFVSWDRGVPDGRWVRCLDEAGNDVPFPKE